MEITLYRMVCHIISPYSYIIYGESTLGISITTVVLFASEFYR